MAMSSRVRTVLGSLAGQRSLREQTAPRTVTSTHGGYERQILVVWPDAERGTSAEARRGKNLFVGLVVVVGLVAFAFVETADRSVVGRELTWGDSEYGLLLLASFLILWTPVACVLLAILVMRWMTDRSRAQTVDGTVVYRGEVTLNLDGERKYYIAIDDGRADTATVCNAGNVGYHKVKRGDLIRLTFTPRARRALRIEVLQRAADS